MLSFQYLIDAAERGWLPDAAIRRGIRRLLQARLRDVERRTPDERQAATETLLERCRTGPIAAVPDQANAQHYEVPAEFFRLMLGPRLKYSCCHWGPTVRDLADAESEALRITCQRGEVADGQEILELGCGWGSLSLWMAERYPASRITAVSNSRGQRTFIEQAAAHRGLTNLRVITADINGFDADAERFDRVLSVEMFEHVRNHGELLRRIAGWLKPEGKLFVHIFCHREQPYLFEDHGPQDWMSRHFFSGGMMPSDGWLLRHQESLRVQRQWRWSGQHYQRTCEAWLARLDDAAGTARQALGPGAEGASPERQLQRWRMFLMACAELFGYRGGDEWWVSHTLWRRP